MANTNNCKFGFEIDDEDDLQPVFRSMNLDASIESKYQTLARLRRLAKAEDLIEDTQKCHCYTFDLICPYLQIELSNEQISEILGIKGKDWQWITRAGAAEGSVTAKSIIFDKGDIELPNEQEQVKKIGDYIELRCFKSEKRELIEKLLQLNLLQSSESEDGKETAKQRFNIFRQVSHPDAKLGELVIQFLGVAEIDILESLLRQKITYKVVDSNMKY